MDVFTQDASERRFSASLDLLEAVKPQKGGILEGAAIVTNTANGEVLALVGGRKPKQGGFNRALDALRPVGSLIKPAIYLTALEKPDRYTVTTRIDDSPVKLDNGDGTFWQPANFDRTFHGEVPLHRALSHSYNVATVRLGLQIGISEVIQSLKKLGLQRTMHAYPSLLLGAEEFSPLEITQMYQTLAGGGFRTPLRAIREVADVNGKPLQRYPLRVEQVFSTESVYLVNKILQQVIKEGTGRAMKRYLGQDLGIAGKTGTTNDLRDSWFAGFTGNRLAVVWVGRDDNKPAGFTGSSGAMRAWAEVMSALPVQPLILKTPQAIEYRWVDQETGLLGGSGCERAGRFPYLKGSAPTRYAACAGGRFRDTLDSVFDWFSGN